MKEQAIMNINRKEPSRFSTDILINHTKTEFRLTFFDTWMRQQTPDGKIKEMKDVVSEIVLTPTHAKALLKALEDNINKYEKHFGFIKLPKPTKTKIVGITKTGEEAYR